MTQTITLTIPGEGAVIALADLIKTLAEGQTPEQKQVLWTRYLELSAPWHAIAVVISSDAAAFVGKLLEASKK